MLALASGYLFSGLLVAPWALTFPGVFAASGLLDASAQTPAGIAALRRIGFPLFVLGYALLSSAKPGPTVPRRTAALVIATVAAVAALAYGLVALLLVGDASLPRLMIDHQRSAAAWEVIPPIAATVAAVALVARRHVLAIKHGREEREAIVLRGRRIIARKLVTEPAGLPSRSD